MMKEGILGVEMVWPVGCGNSYSYSHHASLGTLEPRNPEVK